MSTFKLLLPLALTRRARTALTYTLREEAKSIVMRVFLGMILSSFTIFSLVIAGQHVNDLLVAMENGVVLSIVLFGAIALICSAGLYALFRHQDKEPERDVLSRSLDISAPKGATSFISGFQEGMHRHSQEPAPSRSKRTTEEDSLSSLPSSLAQPLQ